MIKTFIKDHEDGFVMLGTMLMITLMTGRYYDKIKYHYNDEGVQVIDSARLKAVAITPFPVHKDYRLDPINNNDEQRVKGENNGIHEN